MVHKNYEKYTYCISSIFPAPSRHAKFLKMTNLTGKLYPNLTTITAYTQQHSFHRKPHIPGNDYSPVGSTQLFLGFETRITTGKEKFNKICTHATISRKKKKKSNEHTGSMLKYIFGLCPSVQLVHKNDLNDLQKFHIKISCFILRLSNKICKIVPIAFSYHQCPL